MQTTAMTTVATCLLVAGCASHEIGGGEYDEIAQIVGASIATPDGGGVLGGAADAATLALGAMPRGFLGDPGLATGEHAGVTCTYMVFCTGADGMRLDRCSPGAETATVIASWDGTVAMGGFGGSIERHGTWTLTDMTSGMAPLAGASDLAFHATFAASGAYYDITAAETVAFHVDMASHAIVAGSLTSHLVVYRALEASHGMQRWTDEVAADVTFTGTTAKLVLDGAYAYRVDLATGMVSPWYVR